MGKEYPKIYSKIVEYIIKDNAKYYYDIIPIKYAFYEDENVEIFAYVSDRTICVNVCALEMSLSVCDLITIEYFIMHEMRHIFQNGIIKDYKIGNEVNIDGSIIEKWILEKDSYNKAVDASGNVNLEYFNQNTEIDAYAFAYAIVRHKYGKVDVYIPEINQQCFLNWLTTG